LDHARQRFKEIGVNLVLIGQATPRHAAHFRRRQGIDLPVLADEQRASYKAIGAKVGHLPDLVGPKVLAKGTVTALKTGALQGRTIGDPAQLGAAAVVAPGNRVVFKRIARDASDNVTADELLAAGRDATAPV
jgi:hypothetical protein